MLGLHYNSSYNQCRNNWVCEVCNAHGSPASESFQTKIKNCLILIFFEFKQFIIGICTYSVYSSICSRREFRENTYELRIVSVVQNVYLSECVCVCV